MQNHISDPPIFGTHGFSKHYPEMRPFFVATGPAFKSGWNVSAIEPFETVDIYPLLCFLLNITGQQVDGRLENIVSILQNPPQQQTSSSMITTTTTSFAYTCRLSNMLLSIQFTLFVVSVLRWKF